MGTKRYYSIILVYERIMSVARRRTCVLKFVFCLIIIPLLNAVGRPSTSYVKRSTTLHDLQELFAQQPPHCSKAVVSMGSPSSLHDSQPNNPRMRLNAGVGNTVCFRMAGSGNDSTDVLHTLTLVRLEQYYPISQRFRFAIPELETRCICECQAEAKTCQASEYR